MDFRSQQPQASHQAPAGASSAAPKRSWNQGKPWGKLGAVALLFCLTILFVAAIAAISVTKVSSSEEGKYVDNSKYQAVFLTNGQVYFGNITAQGSSYLQLKNIYYLTQNSTTNSSGQTVTDGNYTLVKLGCQQIHDPIDEMVIERSQVSFWENLQNNGKVVTSINDFKKQNPNGPNCSQVSNQTQASSSPTTPQGSTSNNANSTTTKP